MTTSLRVQQPIGEETRPRCCADVFEPDVLMVTCMDTGRVLRIFQPDEWQKATVYDDQGFPVYTHRNSRYDAQLARLIGEAKQGLTTTARRIA